MTIIESFLNTLRPEILTLPAYNSGLSGEFVRSIHNVDRIAKLGSNENPFGASPRVSAALTGALSDAALYPFSSCDDLRAVLSRQLAVSPDRLVFGNGSEDLISICAQTFLAPGREFVTLVPAFGLHVIYAQAAGAHIRGVPIKADYSLKMEELCDAISPANAMVMFSSPSNPVGTSFSAFAVRLLLERLGPKTLLVFDAAYHEYAAVHLSYLEALRELENAPCPWIVLRTFSKAYGLAGLRVGYGIASHPSLVNLMNRTRTPFNVNRLAQVAAVAALSDQDHMKACVARTIDERTRLAAALDLLGYSYSPSDANFLFINVRENAADLAARLLAYGVIVKPWTEPAYAEHMRVSVGSPEANNQFIQALTAAAKPA